MHVIEKATLFTEITVEESATVSGGATVDVGSTLGNQLVSQAPVYYNAVIAANGNPSSTTSPATTTNKLLPQLDLNSNYLINV